MRGELIAFGLIVISWALPTHDKDYSIGYPYPYPPTTASVPNAFAFDNSCPSFCSGRGECINGKCECDVGFRGVDCASAVCVGNCTGRGVCVESVCNCRKGWTGVDCSIQNCPGGGNCTGNGFCFEGDCTCQSMWTGVDCAAPKFGVPGMKQLLPYGFPSNQRLNHSAVAIQLPPKLQNEGPTLSKAVITVTLNTECVKKLGTAYQMRLASGDLVPTHTLTVGSGSHVMCDTFEGCSSIRVDTFYNGSDVPITFVDGVGLPVPSPPPPLPHQVSVELCEHKCFQHGVCVNVTTPHSFGVQFECRCAQPWAPPFCRTHDRDDTMAQPTGEVTDNPIACAHSDSCVACDQYLDETAQWLPLPHTANQMCLWDAKISRCAVLKGQNIVPSLVCRSSSLPLQSVPSS